MWKKHLILVFYLALELRKSAKSSRTESMKSLEKKRKSKNKLEKKESETRNEMANGMAIKETIRYDSIYLTNSNEDDSDVIIEINDDDSENDGEKTYVKNEGGNLSESEEVETKEVNDDIDGNERVSSDKVGGKMEDEVINQREDSTFCFKHDSLCEQGDITTIEINEPASSISNSVIDLKYGQEAKDDSKQGQISCENKEKTEQEEINELTDPVNGRNINGVTEHNEEIALVSPKVKQQSKDLLESANEQFEECHEESESKNKRERSEHREIENTDFSVTKNQLKNERAIDGIQSDLLKVLSEGNATVDDSNIHKNSCINLQPQPPSDTGEYKENEAEDDEISVLARDIVERILQNVDMDSFTDNSTEFTNLVSDGHEVETTLVVDDDARACKIPKDNGQIKHDIEFIKRNLTPKRKVPIVCNICDSEDHYYKKCPLVKREYRPLNELTKEWLSLLERVCRTVLQKHELTVEEFQTRLRVVKHIEKLLRKKFSSE